jgi:hypothetical protein
MIRKLAIIRETFSILESSLEKKFLPFELELLLAGNSYYNGRDFSTKILTIEQEWPEVIPAQIAEIQNPNIVNHGYPLQYSGEERIYACLCFWVDFYEIQQ